MSDAPTSDPPPTVPAGKVIGHYRVVRRLGIGGMGEVYLVQHTGTDFFYAMKILLSQTISDSTALERFRREARTPARIQSDHVVKVHHVDAADELNGAPYLVMDYLRGEDLDQYVLLRGRMAPLDVVTFLQQVSRALDKAHAQGIVHRDLKPENIFVTQREDGAHELKILDFGIAKYTSAASDMISKTATSPGQIYGTPLYMAPEQAKAESKRICAQTDIWALGLIAHRMLTAREYWDAETLTALIAQVVYEPMRKPSEKMPDIDLGPKYDDWFLRCCSRDPEERFSTSGEAVFKLGQALGVIEADAVYAAGRPSNLVAVPPPSLRPRSEPRPLSKTELQLAQTGLSDTPRSDRGTFLKVAGGIAAVGLLIGVVVLATKAAQRPVNTPGDAAAATATSVRPKERATFAPKATTTTLVTPASASAPGASASVSPSASGMEASAMPSGSSSAAAVEASASAVVSSMVEPKTSAGVHTGRPKSSVTAPTGPEPKPSATAPTPPDPLNGRL